MNTFLTGFAASMAALLAIGSQNLFVLKQGMKQEHIFIVCLVSAVCDLSLFAVGIKFQNIVGLKAPLVQKGLLIAGAIFLTYQSICSFLEVRNPKSFHSAVDQNSGNSANKSRIVSIILATLAMSLLNPHVYIDTILVMGNLAATTPLAEQSLLLLGATLGYTLWFFSLGYAGTLLTGVMTKIEFWRFANLAIGVCLLLFALTFAREALS